MAIGIYKKGQGYWTRVGSALGAFAVILLAVMWLWNILGNMRIGELQPVYAQGMATILVVGIFGYLAFRLIGRSPNVVDFMIAVEGEMKKVNWSNRKELVGMTQAVLGLVFFLAVVIWVVDLGYAFLFSQVGVLEAIRAAH